jgi:hypothetical protein
MSPEHGFPARVAEAGAESEPHSIEEGCLMKRMSKLLVALSVALFGGLPLIQAGGEKVLEIKAKGGLNIKGKITPNDGKLPLTPIPLMQQVMLPGKRFQVKLQGGKRYRIAMSSADLDSVLAIQDDTGKQLAWDDDGGGKLNALVMFDPPRDGTYTVLALALKGTGAFNLLIREAVVHEVGAGLDLKGNLGGNKAPNFAYNVKFVAGKTYVIDMVSPDQKALDPYLLLFDPSGKKVAEDDDGGEGLNARIVHRAEASGLYRIVCSSFEKSGAGPYTLAVREKK